MSKTRVVVSPRQARALRVWTIEIGARTLVSTSDPKKAWALWLKFRNGGFGNEATMYCYAMQKQVVGAFNEGAYRPSKDVAL